VKEGLGLMQVAACPCEVRFPSMQTE
jgi:hypothetical protein